MHTHIASNRSNFLMHQWAIKKIAHVASFFGSPEFYACRCACRRGLHAPQFPAHTQHTRNSDRATWIYISWVVKRKSCRRRTRTRLFCTLVAMACVRAHKAKKYILLIGKTGRILARAEIKALVCAAAAMGNNGLHSSRSGQHLFRLNKSFSMFQTQQLSFLEISLRHCFKSNFQRKGNSTV